LYLKKAAGTAAGLTGYSGAVAANIVLGYVVEFFSWNSGFMLITASCVLATLLFAVTWNVRGQEIIKH